jgi:hypothetical protein
MPITTKVVNLNPAHGRVYYIQHYVIKFVSDLRQVPSNKTDRHDITEVFRALTTFKSEGEVTYLSESSLGEVGRLI